MHTGLGRVQLPCPPRPGQLTQGTKLRRIFACMKRSVYIDGDALDVIKMRLHSIKRDIVLPSMFIITPNLLNIDADSSWPLLFFSKPKTSNSTSHQIIGSHINFERSSLFLSMLCVSKLYVLGKQKGPVGRYPSRAPYQKSKHGKHRRKRAMIELSIAMAMRQAATSRCSRSRRKQPRVSPSHHEFRFCH